MSGHSHWAKIKHAKGAADIEKGKTFSKMIRLIAIAARGGSDPVKNAKLRDAIDKAKEINMPSDNVQNAIKRGSGEMEGVSLEEFLFEVYGPGNTAIIIEGITDNKNRSVAEIKQVLTRNNGKMANEGSVKWLFERKGAINIDLENQPEDLKARDNLELLAIDAGAEEIIGQDNLVCLYTQPDDLEKLKEKIKEKGAVIDSSGLDWVAKTRIEVSDKDRVDAEKLLEALDEHDDVQDFYSNLKE